MAIAHYFGADLQRGPTGDVAAASGTALATQRVLRRLLTNPSDYIWQLNYGAGLRQMVGNPADALAITGVITSQMLLEPSVAQTPPPTVQVSASPNGTVYAAVQYTDASTGQNQTFNVAITG